jgi:hypothetical protein
MVQPHKRGFDRRYKEDHGLRECSAMTPDEIGLGSEARWRETLGRSLRSSTATGTCLSSKQAHLGGP